MAKNNTTPKKRTQCPGCGGWFIVMKLHKCKNPKRCADEGVNLISNQINSFLSQQQHYDMEWASGNSSVNTIGNYAVKQKLKQPADKLCWQRLVHEINNTFKDSDLRNDILSSNNPDYINDILCNTLYEIQGKICGFVDPNKENNKKYPQRTPAAIEKLKKELKQMNKSFNKNKRQPKADRKKPPAGLWKLLKQLKKLKRWNSQLEKNKAMERADRLFVRNPWKYVQENTFRDANSNIKPDFDIDKAKKHYHSTYSDVKKSKIYSCPPWMQKLRPDIANTTINHDLNVNADIIKSILKNKKSSSSSGHDSIGYGPFKMSESLHPILSHLFNVIIKTKKFPAAWKIGDLIHIYKKGDPKIVKSFRPISLTPSISKIFTAFISRKILQHMQNNNFLADTQKGFLPKVSGCLEHHALLQQAIDRVKSASAGKTELVLILTDLSNAFGTVRHSLIKFALEFYNFPTEIINLISSIYNDLKIRFEINGKVDFVNFDIGVFQGDVASPILFLCVMNICTQYLNSTKFKEAGALIVGNERKTNFSFADDTTLIGKSIKGGEYLLEGFKEFIDWTECFKAAAEKFAGLCFRKSRNGVITFDPRLKYGETEIPSLSQTGALFRILGKYLPSQIDNTKSVQEQVEHEIMARLEKIDHDQISNRHKITAYKLAFRAFSSWILASSDIEPGWVSSDLDTKCREIVKKWVCIPKRGISDGFLYSKQGLDLLTVYDIYRIEKCAQYLTIRSSKDPLIIQIYRQKREKAEQLRKIWSPIRDIENVISKLEAKAEWQNLSPHSQRMKILADLKIQYRAAARAAEAKSSPIATKVKDDLFNCTALMNPCFANVYRKLHEIDQKFYLSIFLNSTICNERLRKMQYRSEGKCDLCGDQRQHLAHIISCCPYSLGQLTSECNRYLWRHNLVIKKLIQHIKPFPKIG
jgi:hypothetical protein